MLTRAERETIVRLSEDKDESMTVYCHKERLAKRLLKAGGVLGDSAKIDGEVVSWTIKCPREWFREPRPRRIIKVSEERLEQMKQTLSKARSIKNALLITVVLNLLGGSWAQAGEFKQAIGPAVYYSALVGGDWLTTRGAMRRGYSEANPVIQHFGFSTSKSVGGLLMIGGDYALRRHKRAQWGLRAVSGAFYGWAMIRATKAR